MIMSIYIVCDKDCLTAKSTLTPVFGRLQYAKKKQAWESCHILSAIRNWTGVKAGNKGYGEEIMCTTYLASFPGSSPVEKLL